jgi:hypothetical protein
MSDLPEVTAAAPDLIDPIIGYRQWRLGGRSLTSLFNDTRWDRVQRVLEVGDRLGVAAVAHRQLRSVARAQGVPLDPSVRPPRVREPVVGSWRWSLVS